MTRQFKSSLGGRGEAGGELDEGGGEGGRSEGDVEGGMKAAAKAARAPRKGGSTNWALPTLRSWQRTCRMPRRAGKTNRGISHSYNPLSYILHVTM